MPIPLEYNDGTGNPTVLTPLDGTTAASAPTPPATDAPEPATIALFGAALVGTAASRRRA